MPSDHEAMERLATLLNSLEVVTNSNTADHDEAWAIAHGLTDIRESFEKIYGEFLPKLQAGPPAEDLTNVLFDIREEFRHILYHINDMKLTSSLT